MKRVLIPILAVLASGCVSFGVECRRGTDNAWVKVRRFGFAPSERTTKNLADFRERVCR